jgi:hypothetical protein
MNQAMFDVRKFRSRRTLPHPILFLALFLGAFSFLAMAQAKHDKDDQDKHKGKEKAAGAYVKLEGKVRCDKPETAHAIEVPDRPGHALMIEKRKCTWTEPMKLQGAKMRDGVEVGFAEAMEGTLHNHGFEVDKLDNGEELTMHTNGEVAGEKGPTTAKGRWNFMRGTGMFKGIKGGGNYEGKIDADDVLTLEFEGVYDPSDMAGQKK